MAFFIDDGMVWVLNRLVNYDDNRSAGSRLRCMDFKSVSRMWYIQL